LVRGRRHPDGAYTILDVVRGRGALYRRRDPNRDSDLWPNRDLGLSPNCGRDPTFRLNALKAVRGFESRFAV
jgi:hypothetical protein